MNSMRMDSTNPRMRRLPVALLVVTVFVLGSSWLFGPGRVVKELRRHGTRTWGAITATRCRGQLSSGINLPPCERLSPGDTIPVWYDPSNPELNVAGDLTQP